MRKQNLTVATDESPLSGTPLCSPSGFVRIRNFITPETLHKYRTNLVQKDIFHTLSDLSWFRLFIAALLVYITLNIIFTLLYLLPCLGDVSLPDVITMNRNAARSSTKCSTTGAFVFSVMTLSTIGGYDVRDYDVPESSRPWVVFIVFLESFASLGLMALMSAVIVTKANRASRMRYRVVFSPNMCFTKAYSSGGNHTYLAVKLCSIHRKPLIRASIRVIMVDATQKQFTELKCKSVNHSLPHGVDSYPLSILLWTPSIVLAALPKDVKLDSETSLIVALNAVDEMTSVEFQARHMYQAKDILTNHKFAEDEAHRDGMLAVPDGLE